MKIRHLMITSLAGLYVCIAGAVIKCGVSAESGASRVAAADLLDGLQGYPAAELTTMFRHCKKRICVVSKASPSETTGFSNLGRSCFGRFAIVSNDLGSPLPTG